MAGRLIVIEGIDGAGKSTVAQVLKERLETSGVDVLLLHEPGGTGLSEHIRGILKGHVAFEEELDPRAEALLFVAARAQLVADVIKPALKKGTWVLLDRFVHSTMVYQGMVRGLGVEEIRTLSAFATGDLVPDKVLLLNVSELAARQRRQKRAETADRFEQDENFLEQVRKGYEQLATDPQVTVISADAAPYEVAESSWQAVEPLVKNQ